MIKLLIGISVPAVTWLRKEAARLGISVSELVRRIVDEKRGAAK
jgi:hypothetical protein